MSAWNGRPASLAAWCSPPQSRRLRGCRGLIDAAEPPGIEIDLAVEPV
jgi:hypothetical protein